MKVHFIDTEAIKQGYMVKCDLGHESIFYGMFDTIDEATTFGGKLINAEIYPIYAPTLHQNWRQFMTHDWHFEPDDDDCDTCGELGKDECECSDRHEPDTIEEYYE